MHVNPDGSIGFFDKGDFETLVSLISKLIPPKNDFVNYDPSFLFSYYSDIDNERLLYSRDRKLRAPYEIIFDYRNTTTDDWGRFKFKGGFELSRQLAMVKDEMTKLFDKRKHLKKGNNPCPRVCNATITGNNLELEIQKAWYFDQVATNLTLDYKHKTEISRFLGADTIREWDLIQSNTSKRNLPAFSNSNLANTIGVAVGITAKAKDGRQIIVTRRRTSTVAVYPNMLHLPFSFSLNFSEEFPLNYSDSIKNLLHPDFRDEQAEEMGLLPYQLQLSDVKPLLFCRDLGRGGKPQFFLEVELKIPFEDLKNLIAEKAMYTTEKSTLVSPEYNKKVMGIAANEPLKDGEKISPELLAYIVAKS